MTRTVVLSPAAQAEFLEAAEWYDLKTPGLGARFTAEVEAVTERIARSPAQFPVMVQQARRALLRHFPYASAQRRTEDQVLILACFHTSRNPRRWRERL